MPLPRLKLTPAEIAEQERKARKKRLRKLRKLAVDDDDRLEGTSRTLYSDGVGHVHDFLEEDEVQHESRAREEKIKERNEWESEDTSAVDDVPPIRENLPPIPKRWRDDSRTSTIRNDVDLDIMDDRSYSEWIRKGHYRLGETVRIGNVNFVVTDQFSMEARKRKLEEYEREKEEKRRKEWRARKEQKRKEEEEERDHLKRRAEREERRKQMALQKYNEKWMILLSTSHPDRPTTGTLFFSDIPWPQFETPASPAELNPASMKDFVLTPSAADLVANIARPVKDMLRVHFLRFHPDKFNGKIMPLVSAEGDERMAVAEGVGIVMHCLNTLTEQKTEA